MKHSAGSIALLLLLMPFMGGCHFPGEADPITPAGWTGQTVAATSPDYDVPGHADRVQVLVCYGGNYFQHAALRVMTAEHDALLWDPTGTFTERYGVKRHRDIVEGDNTLDHFWVYRRAECGGRYMQVFEFDTTDKEAKALYDALLASSKSEPDSFDTTGGVFDCTRLICHFLQAHPVEAFTVPQVYFFPHNLGLHLWTCHPTRVYLYTKDQPPQVFTPTVKTAADPAPATAGP